MHAERRVLLVGRAHHDAAGRHVYAGRGTRANGSPATQSPKPLVSARRTRLDVHVADGRELRLRRAVEARVEGAQLLRA